MQAEKLDISIKGDFAREAFGAGGPARKRILVVHHHWVPTPDRRGGRPLPRAAQLLAAFEEMGVQVVLGGHVHQTHLTSSRDLNPGEGIGIPLLACGTTASSRGRGPETGENTLNLVRLEGVRAQVVPHRYDSESRAFEPQPAHVFDMPDAPGIAAGGERP